MKPARGQRAGCPRAESGVLASLWPGCDELTSPFSLCSAVSERPSVLPRKVWKIFKLIEKTQGNSWLQVSFSMSQKQLKQLKVIFLARW